MFPLLPFFESEKVTAELVKGSDGYYNEGVWVSATGASSEIKIVFPQPVNQKELQMFADGEHIRNIVKTWVEGGVETRDKLKDADYIQYEDRRYKVMQVEDRSFSGNYLKVFMAEYPYKKA